MHKIAASKSYFLIGQKWWNFKPPYLFFKKKIFSEKVKYLLKFQSQPCWWESWFLGLRWFIFRSLFNPMMMTGKITWMQTLFSFIWSQLWHSAFQLVYKIWEQLNIDLTVSVNPSPWNSDLVSELEATMNKGKCWVGWKSFTYFSNKAYKCSNSEIKKNWVQT